MRDGRLSGPWMFTSLAMTCSPGWVRAQLPPDSAAMSTMMAPYFMRLIMSVVMMIGAFLPGMAAVVMTTSDMATALASFSVCWAFLFGGQVAGVTAGAVGRNAGIDELGAERFDLLTGGGTHVVGFDHGAQTLAGGNGLQAGDTGANDQHAGRADGAGGGGQHREELGAAGGGDQAALVAGAGSLRGQGIHALRARDARQQFEREGGDLRAFNAARRALSSKGLSRPIRTEPSGRAAISSADGGVTRRIRPALP
jgi:hypothetical protein